MQLSNLATAKLAELKAFCRDRNLVPTSDLRLKQSWIDAAQTFLATATEKTAELITAATSPEAVEFYKASAVIALRFTYRAFIVSCLLAIALGMSAADTWNQFREWLESEGLTPQQPAPIVRLVIFKTRVRVKRFTLDRYDRLQDWLESQTVRAFYAVHRNAIQPATEFRNRLNAARFVVTR